MQRSSSAYYFNTLLWQYIFMSQFGFLLLSFEVSVWYIDIVFGSLKCFRHSNCLLAEPVTLWLGQCLCFISVFTCSQFVFIIPNCVYLNATYNESVIRWAYCVFVIYKEFLLAIVSFDCRVTQCADCMLAISLAILL